ncbi:hypothetical protein HYH02_002458 [Chlamydomonas schloesseri]|uniref:Uncharacterized protein n=1 Tax=Chlamydomonas schloesseri TaxID=2026947 RepID=A0A835WT37_9CHLO|nr:hypothetical protein HYH02_002458 [Chlamydomonas schloesseri]|eukprot:KAG2453131.1 hypothetical protein HYH02_002458 [Chlamydomonas schloesseri]
MLRGLKKAFSRGRRAGEDEAECAEPLSEENDTGGDAVHSSGPVLVHSKVKHAAASGHADATASRGEPAQSPAAPPPGGYRGQPIAPARATNAWSFGNLAIEDDAPTARTGSASTALNQAPRSPAAHVTAASPSAGAHPITQPTQSSAAWGTAPVPEKEHKPSKLSALFHRSGSKKEKAEKVSALGTSDNYAHFSDKFREPTEGRTASGTQPVLATRHIAARHGGLSDADDFAASSPSARSGAARTGSLLATPLAVEERRGLVM